jgi:uncharacterized iron-regulated protein
MSPTGKWRSVPGVEALWLAVVLCAGCAPPAARAPAPPPVVWESRLDATHVLVGRIWDVANARFVDEEALRERVRAEPLLAIGEQHDNADHHRIEARLLQVAVAGGRKPAVVLEMIDAAKQADVDGALAAHPRDPDAIGEAVGWAESGWPPWPLYRPIFDVASESGLPIVAAGLDRGVARRIAHEGAGAIAPDVVERFRLGTALAPEVQQALRGEMREVHCGLLPESMLDSMVLVQRARDAELADRLAARGATRGGVLIAGNGHVRNDRGAPRALKYIVARPLLSIALVEVRSDWTRPPQYAAAFDATSLPFDYVWFTPRVSDADHCAEIRTKK